MLDGIIVLIVVLCLILIWVILYDTNRFVIKKETISDARIRKSCRAVIVADLHNKRYGKENEKLLAAIREQKPDFVFVTGDILTATPGNRLDIALDFIGALAKEYPVYYGNGNHEHRLKLYPEKYKEMATEYAQGLKKCGVEPMINRTVKLGELGIAVCGSEIAPEFYKKRKTPVMGADYLEHTLGNPNKDFYTVLLAHNPNFFPNYVAWGADLVLSGHVHGGVVRVPFWGKGVMSTNFRLFPKYDGGIYTKKQTKMILSRGLGTHTIPIRAFNPGELWVVDFEPKA